VSIIAQQEILFQKIPCQEPLKFQSLPISLLVFVFTPVLKFPLMIYLFF